MDVNVSLEHINDKIVGTYGNYSKKKRIEINEKLIDLMRFHSDIKE